MNMYAPCTIIGMFVQLEFKVLCTYTGLKNIYTDNVWHFDLPTIINSYRCFIGIHIFIGFVRSGLPKTITIDEARNY